MFALPWTDWPCDCLQPPPPPPPTLEEDDTPPAIPPKPSHWHQVWRHTVHISEWAGTMTPRAHTSHSLYTRMIRHKVQGDNSELRLFAWCSLATDQNGSTLSCSHCARLNSRPHSPLSHDSVRSAWPLYHLACHWPLTSDHLMVMTVWTLRSWPVYSHSGEDSRFTSNQISWSIRSFIPIDALTMLLSCMRSTLSAGVVLCSHLTLRKIDIWISKIFQKLDIFFKKIAKNCHFFQQNLKTDNFWEIFWDSNGSFPEGQVPTVSCVVTWSSLRLWDFVFSIFLVSSNLRDALCMSPVVFHS